MKKLGRVLRHVVTVVVLRSLEEDLLGRWVGIRGPLPTDPVSLKMHPLPAHMYRWFGYYDWAVRVRLPNG